jgi:hypothetical protein
MNLWQKLIRNSVKTPSGCWRWQGAVDQDGYALVRVGKQFRRGHQVTWEIWNGRRGTSRTTPAGSRAVSTRITSSS